MPLRQISISSYIRRTQIFNLLFCSKLRTFRISNTQYLILKTFKSLIRKTTTQVQRSYFCLKSDKLYVNSTQQTYFVESDNYSEM